MLPLHPFLVPLLLAPCDSTALKKPIAMSIDTLRVTVRGGTGVSKLPQPWVDVLLDELSARLTLPRPLPLPVFVFGQDGTPSAHLARSVVNDEVRLTFRRDRHLAEATLTTRSLSDAADLALLTAVRQADSAGTLPPLAEDVKWPDKAVVFVALTTQDRPEAIKPAIEQVGRDVAVLRLPIYGTATAAKPGPDMRPLRYPQEEQRADVEGDVTVQYVIDETGGIAQGTMRVLSYSTEGFARSVFEVLRDARYVPATVGGCPVRQLVGSPFQFRMNRTFRVTPSSGP
jgi:TonB family protein